MDDLRNQQRLLLFRLVHTINREQELAAPMVMSYLMGWGDTYRSHHYTPIYWSSFVSALFAVYGHLKADIGDHQIVGDVGKKEAGVSITDGNDDESGETMDAVTLVTDAAGRIMAKCQVTDYALRGSALADHNVIEYLTNTYEVNKTSSSPIPASVDTAACTEHATVSTPRHRGRPRHDRVEYEETHPRFKDKHRVVRRCGHHTLPNFIGHYFPAREEPTPLAFYCASMLLLLKPWRSIATDLKTENETWQVALESFVSEAPAHIRRIMCGIQYFHECQTSAQAMPEAYPHYEAGGAMEDCGEDVVTAGEGLTASSEATVRTVTEESVQDVLAAQIPYAEQLHVLHAMEAAKYAGVFIDHISSTLSCAGAWATLSSIPHIRRADTQDIENLMTWKELMLKDVQDQNMLTDDTAPGTSVGIKEGAATVTAIDEEDLRTADSWRTEAETTEAGLMAADPSMLNEDQARAYHIVTLHLDQKLSGQSPPPLRMLLHGEGGTGKSRVIQTISQYFRCRGARQLLLKAAYTGVAASLIDGKTTHTIAMITRGDARAMSSQTKARLQHFWRSFDYLIIDEMSMLGKTFLARLPRNIAIGKMTEGGTPSSDSFGGISVIMCGDFHQFPPVAVGASEPLYVPGNSQRDSTLSQVGRAIYEEFRTVVILKEQIRVTDQVWRDFLHHLRMGRVQQYHVDMLRTLVLTNPAVTSPDFTTTPWAHACLVTPRHAV